MTAGSKEGLEYQTRRTSLERHQGINHYPASTARNQDINQGIAPKSRHWNNDFISYELRSYVKTVEQKTIWRRNAPEEVAEFAESQDIIPRSAKSSLPLGSHLLHLNQPEHQGKHQKSLHHGRLPRQQP